VSSLIELGHTYEVTVDNVSITCEAKETTTTVGSSTCKVYYVGNESLVGDGSGVDTGENFAFVNIINVQVFGGATLSFITHRNKKYPETITASIKRCGKVHKIDEKYMPDSVGTKILDISKYKIDDLGNNINGGLLLLWAVGGGSADISYKNTFWEDVNTIKPTRLKFYAGDLGTLYSDVTVVYEEHGATLLSTTFAAFDSLNDRYVRATIILVRTSGNGINAILVLEPLTIPNQNAE
jgi:hypothetical protein